MDDALVQGRIRYSKASSAQVLILVLMDDALVLFKGKRIDTMWKSLNPCFNG